jgi:hypothetical protein
VGLSFLPWIDHHHFDLSHISIDVDRELVSRDELKRSLTMKHILATLSVILCYTAVSPALGYVQPVLDDNFLQTNRLEIPTSVLQGINGSSVRHLSSVTSTDFTAISHPHFPNHQVRIKKSNFCDPTVK